MLSKFIYCEYSHDIPYNEPRVISASNEEDAKSRIMRKYMEYYDDLECDGFDWISFLEEIWDKHNIYISDEVYDIENL